MTREAKVGLMMVALLVGVFGFLLYKRIHRPPEAFANETARDEEMIAADDRSPMQKVEDDLMPRRKREPSRIGRDLEKVEHNVGKAVKNVEKAAAGTEKLAVDTIEELNPFAGEKKKHDKPKIPIEIPSEDDEFAQFQKPRDAEERKLRAPSPAADVFEEVEERRAPAREIALPATADSDPFANGVSESRPVRPVEFTEPPRRERSNPLPNGSDDRNLARESRAVPEVLEAENETRDPRRESGFDQPSRERRRAAPTTFSDEGTFSDSSRRTGDSGEGHREGHRYVVQPNDNFWSISRKRYGAGRYYMALAKHNQQTISDPKMMKPGIVISTPEVEFLEQRYADIIPKAGPIDSGSPVTMTQSRKSVNTEPSGYFVSQEGEPMYRVGDQDTLTGIAKSHLGRTSRWVQILEMNRNVLRGGNELKIGTVIRLPADACRVQIVGTMREYR